MSRNTTYTLKGDNSCKVYQRSYHTAPALFKLIGITDWKDHFSPKHDLTKDWLNGFLNDSSWLDLFKLAHGLILSKLASMSGAMGFAAVNFHRMQVAEFMESNELSEPCRAWMRATALGGIAGTLRMTVYEFYERIGCNLKGIFTKKETTLYVVTRPFTHPTLELKHCVTGVPCTSFPTVHPRSISYADTCTPMTSHCATHGRYWNTRPPNTVLPTAGFVTLWARALEDCGVQTCLGVPVARIQVPQTHGQGMGVTDSANVVAVETSANTTVAVNAILLAVPPPVRNTMINISHSFCLRRRQ